MKQTERNERQQNKKRRHRRSLGAKVILCALIVMVLAVSLRSYDLRKKKLENEARIEQLQSDIASEQAREKEIDAYAELVESDEFVEQIARERLGLVYPDETLLVPTE